MYFIFICIKKCIERVELFCQLPTTLNKATLKMSIKHFFISYYFEFMTILLSYFLKSFHVFSRLQGGFWK